MFRMSAKEQRDCSQKQLANIDPWVIHWSFVAISTANKADMVYQDCHGRFSGLCPLTQQRLEL